MVMAMARGMGMATQIELAPGLVRGLESALVVAEWLVRG